LKITEKEREKRRSIAKREYTKGNKSIRQIAESHGWSYGQAHRLVHESGVSVRPRGGARR